jgi:competence protein ComEA
MKKKWAVAVALVVAGLPGLALAKHADKEVTGTLNLNQASESQLEQLPGVGPKVAKQIIEHRSQKPFEKPGDVRHVKGVGRATYEKIKDHIAVEGRSNLTAVTTHGTSSKATKPAPKGRSAGAGMAR